MRLVWLVSSVSFSTRSTTTVIKVSGSCCCYCVMCNFKGNSRHVDLMIRLGVSSTCTKLQTEIDALGNKVKRVFQDLSFSVFVRLIEILLLWEFNYVKNLPIELCRVLTYSKSYFMLTYQLVFKSSLLINKTTSKYVSVMWKSQVPSASRRRRVQFKHERLRCNKQKKSCITIFLVSHENIKLSPRT